MDAVRSLISKIILENTTGIQLNENMHDESLINMGMDSIAFVRIIVEIEERLEITIPDEQLLFTEMDTLNKMTDVVWNVLNYRKE